MKLAAVVTSIARSEAKLASAGRVTRAAAEVSREAALLLGCNGLILSPKLAATTSRKTPAPAISFGDPIIQKLNALQQKISRGSELNLVEYYKEQSQKLYDQLYKHIFDNEQLYQDSQEIVLPWV
ncbi:MAG: hypothetical protein HY692_00570, partial [Cyanobacteria bacterium NC_groundwater_1444_Ag_S-0.65um_54_12]|nr:hypothetical protein [Cyanobacteria bacterium NC_groundwater_1444_Ag_S-0.65um_54_12]